MAKVLAGIAVAVALVLVVVTTRPATFHVERSTTIAAPPERVFARVNELREWSAWSPYERKDPDMTRTFDGPPDGTGASYAWRGNQEVGEGRMTIVESTPPSRIVIRLEFVAPFAATNTATFAFAPADGGTRATWALDGRNDFMAKAVQLVMDVDRMVGDDFERGLASLKGVVEAEATAAAGTARLD